MKVKVKDLKVGDKIKLAGNECEITSLELSDIGKQGSKKGRIEAMKSDGEKVVIVRPEEYPIEKL